MLPIKSLIDGGVRHCIALIVELMFCVLLSCWLLQANQQLQDVSFEREDAIAAVQKLQSVIQMVQSEMADAQEAADRSVTHLKNIAISCSCMRTGVLCSQMILHKPWCNMTVMRVGIFHCIHDL